MNLFSSLKILDLTRVFSGPFATRHFADFGAEVIKIEPPTGDDSRNFPPLINNWSGYFELLNRNKKSLFLDLKNDTDLSEFYKLVATCDVVVENFTPATKTKLKIDYQTLIKINPNIIYASLSGVSNRIDKKYYDVIAQAESGLISLNGKDEDMKVSTSVVDAFSGMKLAFAISSALFSREKTGRGIEINVSMKGSAFDLLEQNLIGASISKSNPAKVGNMDSAIAPFGVFKTKDGNVVIAVGNETLWKSFSDFLKDNAGNYDGRLFASNSLRLNNLSSLEDVINRALSNFSAEEVKEMMDGLSVPCAEVKTMLAVLRDRENFDEKLLEEVFISGVGKVVVPTGGIFYSGFSKNNYLESPKKYTK